MAEILVSDLTTTTLDGTGIFDTLMRANKAHLEDEFLKNRIKGSEYSSVYLGSLESVMTASMTFLLQKQKISLEAQLMEQQIILAQVEVQKANALLEKTRAEVLLVQQQIENSKLDATNIPRQGALIDAQKLKVEAETLQVGKQSLMTTQQTANLVLEAVNIPLQGIVLKEQACKLKAEFDLTMGTVIKTSTENNLLMQKVATEKAQILSIGVDPDSVVGRQKSLYVAQTDGFKRDAEQKTAKILVDTWNARRMTDSDDTAASTANGLDDGNVKRAVTALLNGVNA